MPRWLKISLKISGSVAALIVLLWIGLALYVNMNKAALLKKITAQLNDDLNGTLTIETMEPTLLRGFPGISISLKNVVLRDSLYSIHHHDLLQAKEIYVALNAFTVLRSEPQIRNIRINTGKIYLFTDSIGRSNTNIFKKKTGTTAKKGTARIDHVFLNDIDFTFENTNKFKLFRLNIDQMETRLNYNDTGWTAKIELNSHVNSFAFNTGKGSFLKDKQLGMDITIGYNAAKHILSIPNQRIRIDKDRVTIGGRFAFADTPASFMLDIGAEDIMYNNAAALLTPAISAKLKVVDFTKPLDVHAHLEGHMMFRDTPVVQVIWQVKDNIIITPSGKVEDCSFSGMFTNYVVPDAGHSDRNSQINLYSLKARWGQVPFGADTVTVSNLTRPVLETRIKSHFPLSALNDIIGGHTFAFKKGNIDLDLRYKGGILSNDTTAPYAIGTVRVSGGILTYLPRNLTFTNTAALVSFRGSDVYIQDVKLQSASSILFMNGSMRNFLNLYYTNPEKIVLDWHIRSPKIDLNEFRSFLAPRKSKITVTREPQVADKTANTGKASQQLDNMLAVSSVHMQLQVDKLLYQKFTASNINADIQLGQSGITLNNISLDNAGGRLALHGTLDQKSAVNSFHVVAAVENVHIPDFFRSFENFGQDAITDKNLNGRMYANVDVTGSIRDDGKIVPNSFNGIVHFDVRDAALVDFEPFRKISKYVFRNRNLSNITFVKLKDKLEIKGDKIIIDPMLIESSALNVQVRGIYSLSASGTDIDIDVPLRNPKKDELILDDSLNLERSMKGIVVHLKAVDGENGNVRIQLKTKKQEPGIEAADANTAPKEKRARRKRLFSK